MLLVTTKKSSAELAKSIDFLMENNTSVFVKWLSAIIKKLQQVTVSTVMKDIPGNFNKFKICLIAIIISNVHIFTENLEESKRSIDKQRHNDILICETDDVKFGDFDEEKEPLFDSSVNEKNIQALNGKSKTIIDFVNLSYYRNIYYQ